jgi:KRAB domain-containing zinc finger protein
MAFNCEHCDASYPVRKSLINHKRLKHGDAKQFACHHCVYATTNRSHLEMHVRSQHEKIKEICEVCGRGFSDRSKLNKHLSKFHPVIVEEEKESVGTENLNKRKATETLENKSKKSKGVSSLRCSTCTAEFKELKNLNKHIKNLHSTKNIKCDNCSYTTNDLYNFQRHKEGCKRRKREEEVQEQVAKRARTEEPLVYSCNQGPNEDEPSDENQSCFGGSL